MTIHCITCKNAFDIKPALYKRGLRRCSNECRKTGIIKNCLYCKKEYYSHGYRMATQKWCSLICKQKAGDMMQKLVECKSCKNSFVAYKNYVDQGKQKYCSTDCKIKEQIGKPLSSRDKQRPSNQGEQNYLWKGNDVGYIALHAWVKRYLGQPSKCESCKTEEKRMYHWANKSGRYKRELSDWIRLCVPCHKMLDLRREQYG